MKTSPGRRTRLVVIDKVVRSGSVSVRGGSEALSQGESVESRGPASSSSSGGGVSHSLEVDEFNSVD